jgi:hypothetical protein
MQPLLPVKIVSGYGPGNRGSIPGRAKDFSCGLCVQTGSGAPQPPVQWVLRVLSLGVKRGRGVTLTTHPDLVPRSRMSRSYISCPPQAPPWRVAELLFTSSQVTLALNPHTEAANALRNVKSGYFETDICVTDISTSRRATLFMLLD